MNLKLSLLIPLIVFLLTGCAPKNEPTKEFTFKMNQRIGRPQFPGHIREEILIFLKKLLVFSHIKEKRILGQLIF